MMVMEYLKKKLFVYIYSLYFGGDISVDMVKEPVIGRDVTITQRGGCFWCLC